MTKKIIAAALAALMCVGVFSGCQSAELGSYTSDAEKAQAEAEAYANLDYTPCWQTYDADKVMLTVDGVDVTWGELFYQMVSPVATLAAYGSPITDWDAVSIYDSSKTYREYIQSGALNAVTQYAALEAKAAESGIELTAEDEASIAANWQSTIENYGGGDEQALLDYLESIYLTKETYDKLIHANALAARMQIETYGETGEKLSDEEVIEEGEALGYMRVKHIVFTLTDDEGNALTEEQKAEKLAKAQSLREQLLTYTDNAALEAAFDTMMTENSEDTGLSMYPQGYTFVYGDFGNDAFESASQALGEYEVSEVVESSSGYHIILRLPLDPEESPISASNGATLRSTAAQAMFQANITSWTEEAKVVETNECKSLNIEKLFAKAVQKPAETEAPVEEVTEAPAEDATEAPAEDATEAPAEDATEAPTE